MTETELQSPEFRRISGGPIVTKISPQSVPETVARLTALAANRGLKLFAVIDHSQEARTAGLALRDTKVVILGGPSAGTPVMAARPLAALDLPLKILVWEDHAQTKVSYTATTELARRYDLSDELSANLAGIDALTDAVTAYEQAGESRKEIDMSFSEDPTQGRTIGSDPGEDPTGSSAGGTPLNEDPTQGRETGAEPYEDPTQGREIGAEAVEDPTQGREVGELPGEDPTAPAN